jgi:hypothetical protein
MEIKIAAAIFLRVPENNRRMIASDHTENESGLLRGLVFPPMNIVMYISTVSKFAENE